MVRGKPLADLVAAYRVGDEETRRYVDGCLAAADRWARESDAWYLERIGVHTPLGIWTIACPFHPERVRDFSKDNFQWDIQEPWKLTCPLCREEGREYSDYPNPRYPDDGTGCYPSDEVWREDHDAEWSRVHSGIPHDHWDGKPHGYSASGYCYFFIGKCAHEIMTFMATDVLPDLAVGHVLSRALGLREEEEAARYTRKVKVAMVSLARAHLGDAYLSGVLGMTLGEFLGQMSAFLGKSGEGLEERRYPGYHRYDLFDGVVGDAEHPARPTADLYGDGSYRGDAYAQGWLRAYTLVRESFSEEEEPVREVIERLLVSGEGDTDALGDGPEVKPGKLELAVKPFSMSVGSSNNLGGRELANQFDLGVALGDQAVVDAVVWNVWFYLRNYFNGDGLGLETSPPYTLCAWNSMRQIFQRIYGFRGHYDERHPWWDADLGGLNPYRDPVMKQDVAKFVLCMFPDATTIPWMDSHAAHTGLPATYLDLIANEGGGLPGAYRSLYTEETVDRRRVLRPRVDALQSMVLHESKKAILRSGEGADRALLSLNYGLNTGHWHPAPMDLILYAKGHELASDIGYFGAMHWLTQDWISTCEAHNTCLIRDETGAHDFLHEAQGQLCTVFSGEGPVGVVEICEPDPDVLAAIPGEDPVLQRTCVMVQIGDSRSGQADHYVVDIFRARGGHWHDYMLHCQGRQCDAEGVVLKSLEPEKSLYEESGFTPEQEKPRGSGLIRKLRSGEATDICSVTWRNVLDIRQDPPSVDMEAGLRATMLAAQGTRIYLGQAPGERKMSNVDQGEISHVMCARRPNSEGVDRFVSVLEPFSGEPHLKGMVLLPVETKGPDAVALQVDTGEGTDYIVSLAGSTEHSEPTRVALDSGEVLETDGTVTFVSCREGKPSFVKLCGGTRAAVAGVEIHQDREFHGTLVDFDDDRKTLLVESDTALLDGHALENEIIILEHEPGTTTFTIDRVTAEGGDRFLIRLKWEPHLLENRLQVVAVSDRVIQVEPPPSLAATYGRLQYQVYRTDSDGATTHEAQVTGASRGSMELDRETDLEVGTVIGLTRMRKGVDRFRIPGTVMWKGE
jgi:hypothetical protein